MKNRKITNNSTIAKARVKISADLESLEFYKFFDVCLTKFKNYPILPNKISHRFLLTQPSYFLGVTSSLFAHHCYIPLYHLLNVALSLSSLQNLPIF